MIYNSENDPAQFMKSNQCLRPQTAVRGRRRRLLGRTFGSCDGIKEKTLEIDAENTVVMEQCETLSKLQNIEPISVGKHPEDSKNLNPCEDLFSGNMQSTIIHLKIVPAIETSHNDNNKELRSSSFSGSRDLEIGKEVADVEANKLNNSQCVSDLEKVRGVDENLDKAKTLNGFPSSAFAENTDLKVEAENSIKPKGNFKKSFLFDKEEAAAERKEMDSRRIALKEFEIIKQLERNLLDCKNKKRKPMKPRNPSNNNNTMQVIQTKPVEQMPVEQKPVEQKPVITTEEMCK